jgi:hypothetical protein
MPTFIEQLAIGILARFAVIDAVAVADVEAVGGAKPPNGVLHEPWKRPRKLPVKGAGIDLAGDGANDLGTAARAIAGHAIAVGSAALLKDAGAMQKIMDQSIDGNHAFAGLEPMRTIIRGPKQKPGEGHSEDLVGDAVDVAHRTDQRLPALSGEIHMGRDRSGGREGQSVVDPADQVAFGNVADKEEKAIGGLVEATVAQLMARHRAGIDMIGFGAGAAALVVSAAVKVPIGLKQRTGRGGIETRRDI